MLGLGDPRISVAGAEAEPFGYHVMSNLMRFGEYDAGILLSYGNGLIDFERANSEPSDLWASR